MKENLNKNIITVLALEIITIFLPGLIPFLQGPFIFFWLIATVLINISAVFLLLKHKPKLYQLTSIICLLLFILPIVTLLFVVSKIQC